MKNLIYILSFLILILACDGKQDEELYILDIKYFPERNSDFSLWQLEQFKGISQMGYILRTDDNRVVVVDGGSSEITDLIHNYILQLGGRVHYWILTHPHQDHVGALYQLLKNNSEITIERVIHTKQDLELIKKHEPNSHSFISNFYSTLDSSDFLQMDFKSGREILLGEGVLLKILGDKNPNILTNLVNNSSLVFQIKSKSKTVLFTGDLGEEGGNDLLHNISWEDLKSTHVQMAHHGQAGVTKEFYSKVQAKVALWPTPKWLWENNLKAKGYNSGEWKTITVRNWMNDLEVEKNLVSGLEGTIQID